MIKLYRTSGGAIMLPKASNVAVTENLQQPHTLSFDYPNSDEGKQIEVNNTVTVDALNGSEQRYRIDSITEDNNENGNQILRVSAIQTFFVDAERRHIPKLPTYTNANPRDIIYAAFNTLTSNSAPAIHVLTEQEAGNLGMTWIGANGVTIDIFGMDKTNPYSVCEAVIEAYGRGEIYVDNRNIAIVERIGSDNGVRLSLDKNLQSLSIQTQTTELCTRLYPYGKDDMTISSLGDVIDENGFYIHRSGNAYIDSPNRAVYGFVAGYKDYSEYTDKDKLLAAAEYDLFGAANENRLDTPQLTMSGDMIDLSKLTEYGDMEKVKLGDTVHVTDSNGNEYAKRVISITYYPYSAEPSKVTIGSPSNSNPFYVAWQQQKLLKTIQKNSTTATSKIIASYYNGALDSTVNNIQSADGKFNLDDALITIKDATRNRALLGLNGSTFVFYIYNTSGTAVVSTDPNNGDISAVLSAVTASNITATTGITTPRLTINGVDVAAKLADLQQQIDDLRGNTE